MGSNVVQETVFGDGDRDDRLPDGVTVALTDIAGAAREGLLALSVQTGLAVLTEMMEAERTALCGPVHAKDPDRAATRGGTTGSSVVLGGRKVPFRRPRVQATDGSGELELDTFAAVTNTDLLAGVAVERMLAGLATRRYTRANEPVGEQVEKSSSSMSKSSVSRRFVSGTQKALDEFLGRDLSELSVAVLMIDGVDFAGQMCVVAMIITTDGVKCERSLKTDIHDH